MFYWQFIHLIQPFTIEKVLALFLIFINILGIEYTCLIIRLILIYLWIVFNSYTTRITAVPFSQDCMHLHIVSVRFANDNYHVAGESLFLNIISVTVDLQSLFNYIEFCIELKFCHRLVYHETVFITSRDNYTSVYETQGVRVYFFIDSIAIQKLIQKIGVEL